MSVGYAIVGAKAVKGVDLTGAVLANNKGGISITVDRDYDVIIVVSSCATKRTTGGTGASNVTASTGAVNAVISASNGNYGYNSVQGHDMDQTGAVWVYENITNGSVISLTGQPSGFNVGICIGLYTE